MEMTMIDQSRIDRRIEQQLGLKARAQKLSERFAAFATTLDLEDEVVEVAPISDNVAVVNETVTLDATPHVEVDSYMNQPAETIAPVIETQPVQDPVNISDADLDNLLAGIFDEEGLSL